MWQSCGTFLLTVILLVPSRILVSWLHQGCAAQKAESLGLPLGAPYFNSGVMIMDLAAFRKEGYGEKVLQCVTSHAYRHHDQDGLNKVFMGNWSIFAPSLECHSSCFLACP